MEKSKVIGIMLKHTDGDFEYYAPQISEEDQRKIFQILDKYGDDNPSTRGEEAEEAHENLMRLAY